MGKVTFLRTPKTSAALDAQECLLAAMSVAEDIPQAGALVLMLGDDDTITTASSFKSRLMLKGALIHLLMEIDKDL